MKKQQAGMTLIELVIVIIVLGIIAAVAAPKFADISVNAKDSGMEGTAGAFNSAFTIAVAQAAGKPTITQLNNQTEGLTFTAPNVWTLDLDGGGADITITASEEDTCTPGGAIAVGDTVESYQISYTHSVDGVVLTCSDV